jgi:hypothetical protein
VVYGRDDCGWGFGQAAAGLVAPADVFAVLGEGALAGGVSVAAGAAGDGEGAVVLEGRGAGPRVDMRDEPRADEPDEQLAFWEVERPVAGVSVLDEASSAGSVNGSAGDDLDRAFRSVDRLAREREALAVR